MAGPGLEELELLGSLLWTNSSLICLPQCVMKFFIIFSVFHDVKKVGKYCPMEYKVPPALLQRRVQRKCSGNTTDFSPP